jgi:Carboxypeptidase regulatory-like domain
MVARRAWIVLATVAALAPAVVSAQQTHDPNGDVFLGGPKYKKSKAPTSRTLKGTVTDDGGKPLGGALVTLTNIAKGEKVTFVTKQDGRYHFDELPFHLDYEVAASFGNLRSETKRLSQYDNTPEIVRILEVAPSKDDDAKH